eukprot:TRINITY_DN12954_c0_g1_i1.p3 TRINITY_DN12954_c0_g1~~TRINITY_DN12954_c0_g1_i1.p3  ORF type:complete len:106 (+),score=2.82 TRINITY_DN12954_c0_g1_i1:19-336(+)
MFGFRSASQQFVPKPLHFFILLRRKPPSGRRSLYCSIDWLGLHPACVLRFVCVDTIVDTQSAHEAEWGHCVSRRVQGRYDRRRRRRYVCDVGASGCMHTALSPGF